MPNEPTIRPVRKEEGQEAKLLIYSIAHPLMAPQITLQDLMNQWEGWGYFTDLDDVQKHYFDNEDDLWLGKEL